MASMDKIALLELTREDRFGGWGYRFSAGGFRGYRRRGDGCEVSQLIGAERFKRSTERKNYCNGYRRR